MATGPTEATTPGTMPHDLASALRYLARQPILDLRGRVHAYELLFRSGPETAFRGNGELATCTMIDNTIMFGLEKLARGLPGFVNCTAETLTQLKAGLLPPSMTVLEVLEDVEPTPQLIAACMDLKAQGFRLAMDDFIWKPELEPLVRLADYIKIDFLKSDRAERIAMLKRLQRHSVALIAEKVETREDYEEACREGFTLFQGYYFCAPSLVTQHKIPANKISHFQLLRLLQEESLDLNKLAEYVKRDASLTYRLLRLVNSPACAIRQEVRSIQTALLVVGDDLFRRIAMLAIASEFSAGQTPELLRMAFVRARFCELASSLCALDAAEQYLVGIFSLLPAMLHVSMEEVLSQLPLREPIRDALLGHSNAVRCLLQWVEAQEHGDWLRCDAVAKSNALNLDHLHSLYAQAVIWAEETLDQNS